MTRCCGRLLSLCVLDLLSARALAFAYVLLRVRVLLFSYVVLCAMVLLSACLIVVCSLQPHLKCGHGYFQVFHQGSPNRVPRLVRCEHKVLCRCCTVFVSAVAVDRHNNMSVCHCLRLSAHIQGTKLHHNCVT